MQALTSVPNSVQDAQASIEAATALPDSSRAQEAAVPGPATAPAPTVDPTTITEWPPALRWVAKHAAQDAAFIPALKKVRLLETLHEVTELIFYLSFGKLMKNTFRSGMFLCLICKAFVAHSYLGRHFVLVYRPNRWSSERGSKVPEL